MDAIDFDKNMLVFVSFSGNTYTTEGLKNVLEKEKYQGWCLNTGLS